MIQNLTEPALPASVCTEVVQGSEVIRVDVPRADPGPVATKDGVFTKRTLDPAGRPQCVPMTPHEIVSMGMVTRGMDYAATVARGATPDDLDGREFDRFRSLCRDKGDRATAALADHDILKALGLAPLSDPVSLGAILLFGSESAIARWLPTAEVLFQDNRPGYPSTNERQRPLSLDELRVVHEVKLFGAANGTELAESLSILPGTLRAIATRLVEGGLLEARGHGRTRKYHFTARFYDLAEDRNAYVRVKGIDPLQQERMIIDYVNAYGSITRAQAAELCQTSSEQARALLKRLVGNGRLLMVGERRTARYVAAGKESSTFGIDERSTDRSG